MVPLPRLKTDLEVEARSDVHGAYYRLTNADGTRSHRLSQPAYMALSMLDGRFGWDQWSESVQTIYPQVTPAHMIDLLREVAAMGFLEGELTLPDLSAPPTGPTTTTPPVKPMMLSDLEADFAGGNNVPLEVTGIGHAPLEDESQLEVGIDVDIDQPTGELELNALEALFSPTDEGNDVLAPQATQISAPPLEMEDPYLRELGPPPTPPAFPTAPSTDLSTEQAAARAASEAPTALHPTPISDSDEHTSDSDEHTVIVDDEPGNTEEVRLALEMLSDLSSESNEASEPPAPPAELSNPNLVIDHPLPDPAEADGMDVHFTDLAVRALPRSEATKVDRPLDHNKPSYKPHNKHHNKHHNKPSYKTDLPNADTVEASPRQIEGALLEPISEASDEEELPVALGMESMEGAPLEVGIVLDAIDPQASEAATKLEVPSLAPVVGARGTEARLEGVTGNDDADNLISDVSTTVVAGPVPVPTSTDFEQDAIPTAADLGKLVSSPALGNPGIVGNPTVSPLKGALPPFEFDPKSDPSLPAAPKPAVPFPGAEDDFFTQSADLPSLEAPPHGQGPQSKAFGLENADDDKGLPRPEDADVHDPFSKVPSRENPKAHPNLKAKPAGEVGLQSVQNPAGKEFQIYDLEFQLLQLLDGKRDLVELRETFSKKGHPVDEAQLASFIRQMNAYGFLESCGPIVPASSLPPSMPWREGPPQVADTPDQWPAEERRLFQQGLTHFRDGNRGRAESYFAALLELNPENPEAKSMLEMLSTSPDPATAEKAPRKESRGRIGFFLFLLLVTLVAGAGMAIERPTTTTTALELNVAAPARISTTVDGVVAEVFVSANEKVKTGDPLIKLATDDLVSEEAQLKARFAQLKRELELLESPAEKIAEYRREAKATARQLKRMKKGKVALERASKRGSKRRRKKAQAKLEALLPLVQGAQLAKDEAEKIASVVAKVDDDSALSQVKDALKIATSEVKALAKKKAQRVVTAPYSGVLTANTVAVGDALAAGGEVARIARQGAFTSALLLPESAINLVEMGGPINLRMVAFPDETYRGKVTAIGKEIEVVDGARIVRVNVEIIDDTARLKPKMTGTAAFQGDTIPVTILVWRQVSGWLKLRFLL